LGFYICALGFVGSMVALDCFLVESIRLEMGTGKSRECRFEKQYGAELVGTEEDRRVDHARVGVGFE